MKIKFTVTVTAVIAKYSIYTVHVGERKRRRRKNSEGLTLEQELKKSSERLR